MTQRLDVGKQSLALSTPDAYNPFSGGCAATPSTGDCTPSSAAGINNFTFRLRRADTTTLGLADFKLSKADLVALPGGTLGLALGIEGRRETQRDERDPEVNGSIPFVDAVTGATNLSNVSAVSYTPSTLLDIVWSMMYFMDLLIFFWRYALETTAYILNKVPTKSVSNTSYEI